VINGRTRVFAILGQPVSHSLSPAMHNAAFRTLGLDAVYVPLPCRPGDVGALIGGLARAGGGGNVTVPHKEVAARAVDHLGHRAATLGACNTFWGEDGGSSGENTDVAGLLDAVEELAPRARAWLVAGTGGSARAVAGAARERGAALAVRSRDPGRAATFAAWARQLGVAAAEPDACELLINATPLGLEPDDPLPVPFEVAPRAGAALDLVYGRGETAWVRALRARGLQARDGRTMLVAQGAAAFTCWFPGVPAPRDVMRAAVDAALR
jgi:shikimate dehydrogenase